MTVIGGIECLKIFESARSHLFVYVVAPVRSRGFLSRIDAPMSEMRTESVRSTQMIQTSRLVVCNGTKWCHHLRSKESLTNRRSREVVGDADAEWPDTEAKRPHSEKFEPGMRLISCISHTNDGLLP